MIPLSQIILNIRTKYEAESSVRWLDSDIQEAVNEGLDELSESTRFYERHISIPIRDRRTYYDLRGWIPESALGVTSVWTSIRNDWLDPIRLKDLGYQWEKSVGPSQAFFMQGAFWMGVWPRQSGDSGIFRVYFAGLAPHFTHPQAVLMDLPDDFIPALEDYAIYELSAQDGETTKAIQSWTDYVKREKALMNFTDRRLTSSRVLKMGAR